MPLARFSFRLAAAVVLCTLLANGFAAPPAAAVAVSTDEQRAGDLLARTRHNARVPAIRVCADLTEVAQRWSRRMASSGSLGHNPRARDEISGWRAWGENVGVGSSVDVVHGALEKSAAHRANMVSSSFLHAGVGVARGGGRVWVTQVFRSPKSGQGCTAVTATPIGLPKDVSRVHGADRYATAAALSRSAFGSASTVLVASAAAFPDALAAAPLSAKLGAPILLTDGARLHPAAKAEIQRLGARTAVVLGSTAALSSRVDRDLQAIGVSVRRLSGPHRYATAATVAQEVGGTSAVIARGNGTGWADAMAASAYAAHRRLPVFLVDGKRLESATVSALRRLGVRNIDIIGGSSAVSGSVEQQLRGMGITTRRLGGADRLETSAKIADASASAGMSAARVWLATSRNWVDALAAGPAVARKGGVLLLADPRGVSTAQATGRWLTARASVVDSAVLVGGTAVLGDRLGHQVSGLIGR